MDSILLLKRLCYKNVCEERRTIFYKKCTQHWTHEDHFLQLYETEQASGFYLPLVHGRIHDIVSVAISSGKRIRDRERAQA